MNANVRRYGKLFYDKRNIKFIDMTKEEKVRELLRISTENVSVNHWIPAIHEDKHDALTKEIVKLFAIPVVSNNEVAFCVNCDQKKETHSICSDCLAKIINENKQTDC